MPMKLEKTITAQVRKVWGEHPEWTGVKVHKEVKQLNGGRELIGVRKVQQIIAERKGPAGDTFKTFPLDEWKPWHNGKGPPDTSAFLLTLDAVCQCVQSRPLYDHEAKWAMRIRGALQGLAPYDQFCIVSLYAQRELVAFYLSEPEVNTADLDAILAYKPWLPENAHAYGMAILAKVAPRPLPGSRAELSFEDANWNFHTGKAWETLRVDLLPPWYIHPEDVKLGGFLEYALISVASQREEAQKREKFTPEQWERRARDTALQFWMGDNPIFEKPQLPGMLPLIEPVDEGTEEPNTQEEAPK